MVLRGIAEMDAIVAWPKSCDYPLFRRWIRENIRYFKQFIIVFTETNHGFDYSFFVADSLADLPQVLFCYNPPVRGIEDWRDVAVNYALNESTSDVVWFLEQDLIISDNNFITRCLNNLKECDVIGYMDGTTRMHPCNLWVKKSMINQTNRYFGVVPGKLDHFAQFYQELTHIPDVRIHKLPYPNDSFYHMNGLSHNMTLLENGEEITYQPHEFQGYLAMCLQEEGLHPEFKKLAKRGIKELTK